MGFIPAVLATPQSQAAAALEVAHRCQAGGRTLLECPWLAAVHCVHFLGYFTLSCHQVNDFNFHASVMETDEFKTNFFTKPVSTFSGPFLYKIDSF